jgi:hypothetical protein
MQASDANAGCWGGLEEVQVTFHEAMNIELQSYVEVKEEKDLIMVESPGWGL